MLSVREALTAILTRVSQLQSEPADLLDSHGRVLAEDIIADTDSPPFDNSAVDGFAVRSADVYESSTEAPTSLVCVGEVPAGSWPERRVEIGQCMRVMTGAPIPGGADAMVMVEDSRAQGDSVEILHPAKNGDHVRPAGGDTKAGDLVLKHGAYLQAAEIAILASMGRSMPKVIRRPEVAVISTGDEIVDISEFRGPGKIRNSNSYALAALIREAGAALHSLRHIPDDLDATRESFRACAGLDGSRAADVIVTSGGVSVGDRDYVKPVLEELGTLDLWRVNMKPGKPLAFGRIGETLFFGLPGNPVSTMVTFELFVRPALWKMAGRKGLDRPVVDAILDEDVSHTPGREEYVRGILSLKNGEFSACPTGAQGSGMLTSMLSANALLVIPADSLGLKRGDHVSVMMLAPPAGALGAGIS